MIVISCGHTLCKQCCDSKIVKNGQGLYVCPIDEEDTFEEIRTKESKSIIKKMDEAKLIFIVCSDHPMNQVKIFCDIQNKFLCEDCDASTHKNHTVQYHTKIESVGFNSFLNFVIPKVD